MEVMKLADPGEPAVKRKNRHFWRVRFDSDGDDMIQEKIIACLLKTAKMEKTDHRNKNYTRTSATLTGNHAAARSRG